MVLRTSEVIGVRLAKVWMEAVAEPLGAESLRFDILTAKRENARELMA